MGSDHENLLPVNGSSKSQVKKSGCSSCCCCCCCKRRELKLYTLQNIYDGEIVYNDPTEQASCSSCCNQRNEEIKGKSKFQPSKKRCKSCRNRQQRRCCFAGRSNQVYWWEESKTYRNTKGQPITVGLMTAINEEVSRNYSGSARPQLTCSAPVSPCRRRREDD